MEHVTFITFVYQNLVYLRELYPAQSAQYLVCELNSEVIAKCTAIGVDLDVLHTALTRENVAAAHAAGLVVNCWTVDTVADAERVIACGVDYITSNILETEA